MTTCCPFRDARLASSLNYSMHKIPLYPMVRIASPLTLLMLTSRHCGPATGGQYKEILVIHSSFLMRLLSHNPLSTPFDPPVLGDREEELGDTPHPEASLRPNPRQEVPSTLLCHSRGGGNPAVGRVERSRTRRRCLFSTPLIPQTLGKWASPLRPPGQSPLPRRERMKVRVTATVTDPAGLPARRSSGPLLSFPRKSVGWAVTTI